MSLLAGVVVSGALGAGVARALPEDPPDTLPLSEVKPGMKGYGLTVFSGTKPEKFDVEIISTLHNFRPSQDLVLIKTPHPRLEITRTVAGMSGSPIYLNGKMIGAYAYGWLFGSEAVAGVTPIKSMLNELKRPVPRALLPEGTSPLVASNAPSGEREGAERLAFGTRSPRAFVGAPEDYDLARHGKQLAADAASTLAPPNGTSLARASTPILIGGMSPSAVKIAGDLLAPMGLEPLQAGGGSTAAPGPDVPMNFEDGGAIGVELVRGDITAMGLGTVTRVSGDHLVAFGHPMLGGGLESLPTAIARVHWILASENRSFKIGEAVRSLGALVNDRPAAIVVDSSLRAPTFPIHLDIVGADGAPKPSWNVEVAHDPFMAPSFVSMALGSALETTTGERHDLTWRATSKLRIAKYGSVTLEDFGAGAGNPLGADDMTRARLVHAIGGLLSNSWEPVIIERVDVSVRVSFTREVSALRGVKVLETEIDAGAPAHLRLDLQPFQGRLETRIVEVPIPSELAGREVEIEVAPGYDVERPLAAPESVAELFANLPNQTYDAESVVATVRLRENGAAYRGKVAARMPPGAADTFRPTSQSDAPEFFAASVQTAFPMKRFIVGHDTARVQVRPVLR